MRSKAGYLLSEYRATLASLALLAATLTYAVLHQRLFDFMLAVVLWLQLELAYRQWWLEKARRGPQVWVEVRNSHEVCVKNVGQAWALDVDVTASLCSGDACESLVAIMIASGHIDLPPGAETCVAYLKGMKGESIESLLKGAARWGALLGDRCVLCRTPGAP